MATVTEVIHRTGSELGLLRLGQSLQAQDNTRITASYNEEYAKLKKDGLAIWASDGVIPDDIVPSLVFLMADNCLGSYGVSNDRFQRIKLGVKFALREIQKFTAPNFSSQDEASDY